MTGQIMTDQRITDETRDRLADSPAAQSAPADGSLPALASTAASPSFPAVSSIPSSMNSWWRIADFGVLGLWIVIVSFTINYHEKWADEAQAWLIARDLDLRTIWFHELRYEGSPGLWHTILWVVQHVFHAKYDAIGYIGMAGATAGVALLIFKAPFPRIIRWPLAFTYVMVYQYAVIARPYTLLPLLAFGAAILFNDIRHPERMTVVLILLASLSVHGTIFSGCFGMAYLIEAVRSWRTLEAEVRTRYQICVAVMALTFLFLFIILKPTPDIDVFLRNKEIAQMPPGIRAQIDAPALRKLSAIISGAFLDYLVPSVLFVALVAAWCLMRRRFLIFVLPGGALIALYFVQGYPHHHGTLFIAAITALWIAWPDKQERRGFGVRERRAAHGMVLLLLCLCAVNIVDGVVVIHHEHLYPYSGAEDAAKYLKSVGADRGPIFGFSHGMAGVQAYFDHNILANTPTAYFHHGLPLHGLTVNVDELQQVNPEYVVAYSNNPDEMLQQGIPNFKTQGYVLVHFSDGYNLYKRIAFQRETYFIFRRTRPGALQTPARAQN
jgi:hypothetical protein